MTSWSPPAEDICTVPCPTCATPAGVLCDTPATGLLDWRDQDGHHAWTHGVHGQRFIAFCESPDCDRVCAERIRRDRLLAEHRAALDVLGISAELEQEMADIARAAMGARQGGEWCEADIGRVELSICSERCPTCGAAPGMLCDTSTIDSCAWPDAPGRRDSDGYLAHLPGVHHLRWRAWRFRMSCGERGTSIEDGIAAVSAMGKRDREHWIERVCTEEPPPGLTDIDVLADWYEERGFRALRACANEEWGA